MINAFTAGWQLALLQALRSGWTIIILVTVSLLLCWVSGRHAFAVWWLVFSGTLLVGISVGLGNLPYRLLQPGPTTGRWSGLVSWVVWAVGALLLAVAPIFANTLPAIFLGPAGVLSGALVYLWVSHREPLKWTR